MAEWRNCPTYGSGHGAKRTLCRHVARYRRAERPHPVVADPAFLLESAKPSDAELKTLFESGNKIGFDPTFALLLWWQGDAHLRRCAAALDALVESESAEFVAMPMSVLDNGFDDVKTANPIRSFMRYAEAMHVYDKRLTANELKWATGQARLNITVRLHAMIFSLGCDVPVVAVNYELKVGNVFNVFAEFNAPECPNAWRRLTAAWTLTWRAQAVTA